MKIHFFTIVLDGMPWITHHLPILNKLEVDWDWTIVEGASMPNHCTSWVHPIRPRLSVDGTHEYVQHISRHPNVRFIYNPKWPGKVVMINTALSQMKEPGILWEIDADEIWTANQIFTIYSALLNSDKNCAEFYCRQFVGFNIVVDRISGTWSNEFNLMWRRVWKYDYGMQFKRHEPPIFGRGQFPDVIETTRKPLTHDETEELGCVFDHYAYVLESQVKFKEVFYGYQGAIDGWRRLQASNIWPVQLKDFLPWIKDNTTARKLYA